MKTLTTKQLAAAMRLAYVEANLKASINLLNAGINQKAEELAPEDPVERMLRNIRLEVEATLDELKKIQDAFLGGSDDTTKG